MTTTNKAYNRLVIVGNGFDLALGLNTTYSEFILHYLKAEAKKYIQDPNTTNKLFTFENSSHYRVRPDYFNSKKTIKDLHSDLVSFLKMDIKNYFFEKILTEYSNSRWVDIEQAYYDELKRAFLDTPEGYHSMVKATNECMDILAKGLQLFIIEQQNNRPPDYIERFYTLAEQICESLPENRRKNIKDHAGNNPPESILYLNFNYTNTVKKFVELFRGENEILEVRIIPIHGSVDSPTNPIIFGYGDDTGDEYKTFENQNNPDLLRMIKSFKYPKTSNYHNLLGYLEKDRFEVSILGHSCGLSDRTLLKSVFEHKNCVAIQSYYYKDWEEFFFKTIEISRHFSDKPLMRERLLSFDETAKIPQVIPTWHTLH
ncbi:AbiH family protein [Prolixibacteraceae bacterium Z1-6]|uniref:AbiH family protein n=1 Tax=Draconibacterium aestuarii TaxID=2998507 RepID=A0A9X3J484_9BACT|nr:AbiH family protein [Prolixibacteraceae bacterium Z1-6]